MGLRRRELRLGSGVNRLGTASGLNPGAWTPAAAGMTYAVVTPGKNVWKDVAGTSPATLDGDLLDNWTWKAPAGTVALVNAGGADRPKLKLTPSRVQFDGVNWRLTAAGVAAMNTGDWTAGITVRRLADSGTTQILLTLGTGLTGGAILYVSTGTQAYGAGFYGDVSASTGGTSTSNVWDVLVVRRSGTTVNIYQGPGAALIATGSPVGSISRTGFALAANPAGTFGDLPGNVDVAAAAFVASALSNSAVAQLAYWLKTAPGV